MDTSIWDQVWTRESEKPLYDDAMCLFLAQAIDQEACRLGRPYKSAVEMGAGSGRTSRYLNEMGAVTGVLDISAEALKFAKFANTGAPREVHWYLQDLFQLSENTLEMKYDLVWNAGVLEHFAPEKQRELLDRMANVLTPTGTMMILTPYAGSVFYRLGKFILETLGRFPYGQEVPVRTLLTVVPERLALARKEYSMGFLILFFNGFKAFANVPGAGKISLKIHQALSRVYVMALKGAWTRRVVFGLDRILSRIFGGYLLLTVLVRRETPSQG